MLLGIRRGVVVLMGVFLIMSSSLYLDTTFPMEKRPVYYVPPLEYLRLISGSFESLYADIFYIRGILAITDEFEERVRRTDWVQANLEVATNLDPKLVQAYFFGGVVVPHDDEESIRKGIQFLERGIQRSPDEWQLPYWAGFNHYQLGEYLKAIEYYEKASNFPDAPKFLRSIQPMYYYRAGRADLGVIFLEGLLHSVKDPEQLEWIESRLRWLQGIVELEEKVEQFREIYGRLPEGLEELKRVGLIEEIPQDPFGRGYYLDEDSNRVRSRFGLPKPEEDLEFKLDEWCPRC